MSSNEPPMKLAILEAIIDHPTLGTQAKLAAMKIYLRADANYENIRVSGAELARAMGYASPNKIWPHVHALAEIGIYVTKQQRGFQNHYRVMPSRTMEAIEQAHLDWKARAASSAQPGTTTSAQPGTTQPQVVPSRVLPTSAQPGTTPCQGSTRTGTTPRQGSTQPGTGVVPERALSFGSEVKEVKKEGGATAACIDAVHTRSSSTIPASPFADLLDDGAPGVTANGSGVHIRWRDGKNLVIPKSAIHEIGRSLGLTQADATSIASEAFQGWVIDGWYPDRPSWAVRPAMLRTIAARRRAKVASKLSDEIDAFASIPRDKLPSIHDGGWEK